MTRKELQALARVRLGEAKALLATGHPEGAYYLAGYAAECAFKACIAKQTQRHEFPDLARAQASWRHNLEELAVAARLVNALNDLQRQSPEFNLNWTIVRKWREQSRYDRPSHSAANALICALEDRKHGVITWLKRHW